MNDFSGIISQIAESRINEANERGELDNLPGMGKPMILEDLSNVPEELRMAYKILKNAGCLPPEAADRKEAINLLECLDNCPDEQEKLLKMRKLAVLAERMSARYEKTPALAAMDEYYLKILDKVHLNSRNKA